MRSSAVVRGLVAALLLACATTGCGARRITPPPVSAPISVLPLGDSITYGFSDNATEIPGGYRGYLSDDLDAAGVEHTFVGTSVLNPPTGRLAAAYPHDGWPGRRVEEIQQALLGASPTDGGHWLDGTTTRPALDPDVVVVHLGTNDIGQAFDPGTTYAGGYTPTDPDERRLFVSHLTARLTRLVGALHDARPGAGFVLCTIVAMPDPTAAAYDDAIRRVVLPRLQDRGLRVVLADVEAAVAAVPSGVSVDLVHPSAAGYEAMGAAIAAAVTRLERG